MIYFNLLFGQQIQIRSLSSTNFNLFVLWKITDSIPKDRVNRKIRQWACGACNATHDRRCQCSLIWLNTAKSILCLERQTLAVGSSLLEQGKYVTQQSKG